MPHLFTATGERILEDMTGLETASAHAVNYGTGMRFNVTPPSDQMPAGYGFVGYSHRTSNETALAGNPGALTGDRILTGLLMQY
jgi:hypothetical protein